MKRQREVIEFPLAKVVPDLGQPRKFFDPKSLGELAESIKQHGSLPLILVRLKAYFAKRTHEYQKRKKEGN
jgi:ParB-like chromosome segregation protein Spo0J